MEATKITSEVYLKVLSAMVDFELEFEHVKLENMSRKEIAFLRKIGEVRNYGYKIFKEKEVLENEKV